MSGKKLLGEERRWKILQLLKESNQPITGNELSKTVHVSRQVIVGDITQLKKKNAPIIATSQGYLYLQTGEPGRAAERIVSCGHGPDRTEEELFLLVDLGVSVQDVRIEHSVYGTLTASIMVSSRMEAEQFLQQVKRTKARYLSELTEGVHFHMLSAHSEKLLDQAEEALRDRGFLIE
ncbi:transcription repressor NadR [Bacillus massiliglaciei]|uniref:transcription repressor NadR n=1 Tax=Bacillus massiliglaciei TaxID=1816693 RepID=UPI000A49BB87